MAENVIGSAWVAIHPDTSGFESSLTSGTQGPIAALAKALGPQGIVIGALAGAAIAAGGWAVDLASKYSSSLAVIQANMGITADATKKIGDAFLSTAGWAEESAGQIADAFGPVSKRLEDLNGAALTAKGSLDFMKQAMILSEATGQDLNGVTADLTAVMVAYHLPLSDAGKATDILTNASIDLNQPVDSLAGVIDKLHGKLGEATPSLGDVAGLMVDLANNGVPARLAVSSMSSAITSLLDPTPLAAKAIEDIGLKALDAKGNFVGMDSIISQLQPKFEPMNTAQRIQAASSIFGASAASAMVGIVMKGPKAFDDTTKSISNSGSAQEIAGKKTDTLKSAWDRLVGKITDFMTGAGGPVQEKLKQFVGYLNDHLPQVAIGVAAVGAAFLTWAIVTSIKAMVGAITDAFQAAVAVVKGIGIAAWWLAQHAVMLAGSISFHVQYAALWVAEKAGRIADFAVIVAAWVAANVSMMADAIAKVAVITATWVAQKVGFIAGTVEQTAAWGVSMTTMTASAEGAAGATKLAWLGSLGAIAAAAGPLALQIGQLQTMQKAMKDPNPQVQKNISNQGGQIVDWFTKGWADGGVIPAGQWGITGENGPELTYGGPGGTSVLNKSQIGAALGGGGAPVTITQHYHVGSDNQAIVEAAVRKGNRELISALQAGRR